MTNREMVKDPHSVVEAASPAARVRAGPRGRPELFITAEQPSSILLRPTKLPESVLDPEVTGSLPLGEQQLKVRDGEPAIGTIKTSRERKPNRRERPMMAKAKTPKAEQRARAEQRPVRGRLNRSSPIMRSPTCCS
jgi:hypothetical protein